MMLSLFWDGIFPLLLSFYLVFLQVTYKILIHVHLHIICLGLILLFFMNFFGKKFHQNYIDSFPKGARSTRAVRPPLSLISKVKQVSRQLVFCDVDLQQCPAHKKRGVDIKSSKELYLMDSSKIASADPYESNIGGISQKLKTPHSLICQNNANSSIKYTLDRPPLTISCLLTNGLLERLLEHYKKDRVKCLNL